VSEAAAIDEAAIMAVLETVPDPEIPVLSITDLGIVRGFAENPQRVLVPPWTTDWITPRGHQRLKAYGIAPPSPSATAECPQCGSTDTVEVSRFGATPCKAQWRCRSCLEPFERFKCH
jgi:ring-1,2-phenylacetyl-CoA epoxidase subunit PaaD